MKADSVRNRTNKVLGPSIPPAPKRQPKSAGNHRPEGIERMSAGPKAQGRDLENCGSDHSGSNHTMGLHTGSQIVLPPPGSAHIDATVDEIQARQRALPIRGHAVRLVDEPLVGQQTCQAGEGLAERQQNPALLVGRRCPSSGKDKGTPRASSNTTVQHSHKPRDTDKSREKHEGSGSEFGVRRSPHRSESGGVSTIAGKKTRHRDT